jgi:hypothetical protein
VETSAADGPGAAADSAEDADGGEEADSAEDAGDAAVAGSERRRRVRPVLAQVATVLAGLMVYLALVGPDDVSHRTLLVFLRLPVEALVAAAVLLVLPARVRRVVAMVAGASLGLLAVLKIVDLGFYLSLDRPFDLVLDWGLFGDAVGFVESSIGRAAGIGVVVALVLLVIAGLVLMVLSMLRLSNVMAARRPIAVGVVAALAAGWVSCAAFGAQFSAGVPVANRGTASLVHDRVLQVRAGLHDKQVFATETAVDPFRDVPANELLGGLRGKDVIFSFVESYGRDAVQDPEFATQVDGVLDAGTRRLDAAGFASRSAFLTSPTAGGGSWLAHASLFTGLWINNQQRYRTVVSSDRLTLPAAFHRAGWRTVSLEPAIEGGWPEREFYGYDRGYSNADLGYRGPRFSYAPMPDQYTFATLQRTERTPGHAPLMAEVTLVSSHAPWTPLPRLVDWKDVGDGSVFGPMAVGGVPPNVLVRDTTRFRAAYRQSIEYSLGALISYVEKYGDDNLVFVFLGDHQPAPIITGAKASRDVPVTIVARDRSVLNRISTWGWQDGLRPGPQAPVWGMDTFRNRFLTTFGPSAPGK